VQSLRTAGVGVVEYRISDAATGVIDARYMSTGTMAQRPGAICLGTARGDTSNGFPGDYQIRYLDVDGQPVGDFDWRIEGVGEGLRLAWRNRPGNSLPVAPGVVVFEGFGFQNSDRSIAVVYWLSAEVTEALEARAASRQSASDGAR
jgi:hypothetical protein